MAIRLSVFLSGGLLACYSLEAASAADINLQPTAAARAGAGGVATFENDGGGTVLVATIRALGTGTYGLSAIRKSDAKEVPLGMFVVADPTAAPDEKEGQNRKKRNSVYQAENLQIQAKVQLPPGLAPADIAEIRVSGSGGVLLLSGKTRPVNPAAPTQGTKPPRPKEGQGTVGNAPSNAVPAAPYR